MEPSHCSHSDEGYLTGYMRVNEWLLSILLDLENLQNVGLRKFQELLDLGKFQELLDLGKFQDVLDFMCCCFSFPSCCNNFFFRNFDFQEVLDQG